MLAAALLLLAFGRTPACDVTADLAIFTPSPVFRWDAAPGGTPTGYTLLCRPVGSAVWDRSDFLPCFVDEDGVRWCPGVDFGVAAARCGDPISGELWEFSVTAQNDFGESSPSPSVPVCWPLTWY